MLAFDNASEWQKHASLLYLLGRRGVGRGRQETIEALSGDNQTFSQAMTKFENHLIVQRHVPSERSFFHPANQEQGECIDQ